MVDLNESPLNFNKNTRICRCIDQLIGICAGIVADGQLNHHELAYLETWLTSNKEICGEYPANTIRRRIEAIRADSTVTQEELADLMATLQELTQNYFSETGQADAEGPSQVSDVPEKDSIELQGKVVCLTGKFTSGTRSACEARVQEQGGFPEDDVTSRTDFLIVGGLKSPDWKHGVFGNKIKKALGLKEKTGKPIIFTEEEWVEKYGAF